MERPEFEYDIAMVAFLDVLGWSNLIMQSASDDALLQRMGKALEKAGVPFFYPGGKTSVLQSGVPSISVFSDSMIISQSITNPDPMGMDTFWETLDMIGKTLARHGFFIRGGITKGLMYHRGQIAMGPALLRAYQLENIFAVSPRIILDRTDEGETVIMTPQAEITTEAGTVIKGNNTRITDDGWEAVDVLRLSTKARWQMEERANELHCEFLEAVRPHVVTNLQTQDNPRVLDKYVWFANYFNEVAAELGLDEIAA